MSAKMKAPAGNNMSPYARKELIKFGRRVKECRVLSGRTMIEFSKDAQVSQWCVRHVERGDFIHADEYMRCAQALGLEPWILFAREPRWQKFLPVYKESQEAAKRLNPESRHGRKPVLTVRDGVAT